MTKYWIVYRDIQDFPRKSFERIDAPKPGDRIVKDQKFPGMYGYPDMYVRRHHIHIDAETVVNLITYTEHELAPGAERQEIMRLLEKFLDGLGAKEK